MPPADPPDELLGIFQDESRELLADLSRSLLELEANPEPEENPERLRRIFRLAHTLKGAAASVGREDFARVAHALETALEPLRRGEQLPSAGLITAALATTDLLGEAVERSLDEEEMGRVISGLEPQAPPSQPRSPSQQPAPILAPRAPRKRRRKPEEVPLKDQLHGLLTAIAVMANGAPVEQWNAAAALARGLAGRLEPQGAERRVVSAVEAALLQAAAGRPAQEVVEAALLALDLVDAGFSAEAAPQDLDAILGRLDRRQRPVAAKQEAPRPASGPTLRIPVALMDSMLYRLDELVALRLRIDFLRRGVELSQEQLESATLKTPVTGALASALDANRRRLEALSRDMAQEVHYLGVVASALQDDVKDVRMVPIGPVLEPFRRVVRDLALKLEKQVLLAVEGQEVRVDKRVLDLVRDPLTHLLRNAVDHGLERPEERRERGKDPVGQLRIVVESRDAQIMIQVIDDGRGISPAQVKAVAVARRVVDPARADSLTDRELLNLIFSPGFSTASEVTETSGRGVGLDVVRENVAQLGGRIEFFSEEGRGAQFNLTLPLALSVSRGLIVGAGRQTYCIPLGAVEEVLSLEPPQVGLARGRLAIQWRHQAVPFARLEDVLRGTPSRPPERRCFAVLLALSDLRVAIGVDEVQGQEAIVVKAPAGGAPRLPFVGGVAGLADGRLISVLEPTPLLDAARGGVAQRRPQEEVRRQRTVVVADDSLTSRTLVSSVLEGAGYRTLVAPDGESAFALLSDEVGLLVSDVEMPVLDGLALVRRVRATETFSSLPVILLTSLGDAQDRARGAEAGASGYVNKRAFDPGTFLQMVQDFLGGP